MPALGAPLPLHPPVFDPAAAEETRPPPDPWASRLVDETRELGDRIWRLQQFISGRTPGFLQLDDEDRRLLQRQHDAMMAYHHVLATRCAKHGLTLQS